MREVEIETILKKMDCGVSRPVLAIGDDFKEYILKNEKINNDSTLTKYDCMFVNELLAYQIGLYLGVPMPEAVIALVNGALIEEDPTLVFSYRFQEGKYFATERLKYVENNLKDNYENLMKMGKQYIKTTWNNFFKEISNTNDVANILAFDILIANFDRYNNTGNILIDKTSGRKVYAIDHGHAFWGPIWNEFKIQQLNLNETITQKYFTEFARTIYSSTGGRIFQILESYINLEYLNSHSFQGVVGKILNINESMIDNWLNNIPTEWYVDKNLQCSYYKKFLLTQKNMVQCIIQVLANQNAFTNYKGGVLQWEIQKEKSLTV